jgi:hypothetical protein
MFVGNILYKSPVSLGISVVNGRPTPEVILYRETELDTREINCRKREKQLGGGELVVCCVRKDLSRTEHDATQIILQMGNIMASVHPLDHFASIDVE